MTDEFSLSTLADAVRTAATDRTRHRHLEAQVIEAQRQVDLRADDRDASRSRLIREQDDVRSLERLSPSRLWATLRGDIDDKLATERAEADVAARAAAAAEDRLTQAQRELTRVRRERDALGDTEAAYTAALAVLESAALRSDAPAATELGTLSGELGSITEERREIDEAHDALGSAQMALTVATDRLESAGGWSTYDTFFGGGFVADLMKHSRIDEATAAFTEVNRALEKLSTELADIGATPVSGVELTETLTVFDVLFDNIFSDLMVREAIARARDGAAQLERRLAQLETFLDERMSSVLAREAEVHRRREEILTGWR